MPAQEPVGAQIAARSVREALGLSQPEVVERMTHHGAVVSVAQLSRIETGKRHASNRVANALALALGVKPLDLWQPPHLSGNGPVGQAADNSGTHPVSPAPKGAPDSRERLDRPAAYQDGAA